MTEEQFLEMQENVAKALYENYSSVAGKWERVHPHVKDGWYERAVVALEAAGLRPS